MSVAVINSFKSEWLKKRRTAAFWLVIIGGFFIPAIMFAGAFVNIDSTVKAVNTPGFWNSYHRNCWQFMAVFLLPVGVIMSTSLITQLEYRNNTWKQLHTTPQTYPLIFFTKLSVIITMMLQFFIFFNIGVYLSGILPSIISAKIPFPKQPYPWQFLWQYNEAYFVDCLPMIALQYLVSLKYKNFLVAIGIGLGILLASLFAVQWKYGYVFPYTYCILHFLGKDGIENTYFTSLTIHYFALAYFILFTIASYFLYITKKEKG